VDLLTILLFAIAVSADGFMVGIAYGIKKIYIPVKSLVVISIASALAVSVSMGLGRALAAILPVSWTLKVGAMILIFIGFFFMLRACREKIISLDDNGDEPLVTLNIKTLGIIVHILKEPHKADFDSSGEISTREAFILGIALALDALGAGVGIAMAGCNILLTAITVGMLKFILVNSGIYLGTIFNQQQLNTVSSLLPGIIFIVIGLSELIF